MAEVVTNLATYENQVAAKAVIDDTNTRVRSLQQDATPIGAIYFHRAISRGASGNDVYVQDPPDRLIGGLPAAYWSYTVCVRKEGSAPESETDGTVIFTNQIRDNYFSTPFRDEDGTSTSVYRVFPHATNGSVNLSAENIFQVSTTWTMGFILDTEESDPSLAVTYTADNTNFNPVRMDFTLGVCNYGGWKDWVESVFYPAMLTYGGEIDYRLYPNDLSYKADGTTASDIANTSYEGNAMLIVPQIFLKITRNGPLVTVLFSNEQKDSSWFNWTHLKSDGTYADFCAWPLFEGSNVSSRLRSMSTGAKPLSNTNQNTEYSYARANGDNWYPTTWADELMFRLLFPLLTKHLDSNEAIGQCYTAGVSALQLNCGSMKDKGWFWGAHFDGTNNVTTGVKFLCMENLWSHRWRRSVGANLINGIYYTKTTPSTVDGSGTNYFITSDTAANYQSSYLPDSSIAATNYSANYITKMHFGTRATMVPVNASGGSSGTFFCDACWSASGVRCFLSGGHCFLGLSAGVFASYLSRAPSDWTWNFGASLSYHAF